MIRIIDSTQVGKLLARKAARFAEAEETVRPILENVRNRGDKALLEYARKFDNQTQSTYGLHQVATGPYMIKNDASGNINGVGYQPNKLIELVRTWISDGANP